MQIIVGLLSIVIFSNSLFAKDIIIIQKNKSFQHEKDGTQVKAIEARIGDVIRFRNDDNITHNVYSVTTGNEFEIKVQKPGETGIVDINAKNHKKGKMEVECAIHPNMKLLVNIKK